MPMNVKVDLLNLDLFQDMLTVLHNVYENSDISTQQYITQQLREVGILGDIGGLLRGGGR